MSNTRDCGHQEARSYSNSSDILRNEPAETQSYSFESCYHSFVFHVRAHLTRLGNLNINSSSPSQTPLPHHQQALLLLPPTLNPSPPSASIDNPLALLPTSFPPQNPIPQTHASHPSFVRFHDTRAPTKKLLFIPRSRDTISRFCFDVLFCSL